MLFIGPEMFEVDEHPRPQTTMESLTKLPPVFKKNGTVTAGNASVRFLACSESTPSLCLLMFN